MKWIGALFVAALAFVSAPRSTLAGTDTVKNDSGISVKVITTRACKLYADADANSDSQPIEMFRYWYVLPPDPNTKSQNRNTRDLTSIKKNGFYRVASGELESSFRGWLNEEDVVEWHHRQALRFTERQGRELAHFYHTKEETEKALKKEPVDAFAEEPEAAGDQLILMPLLNLTEINAGGDTYTAYEVAFVAGDPAAAGTRQAGGANITTEMIRSSSTIDIVFVVDTTASMEPTIAQVRRSVTNVAKQLTSQPELKGRLRFGLVAYRDTIANMEAMEYLTKVFCTLEEGANHETFLQRIGGLKEASVSSEDYPEDVLAGVNLAMDSGEMKWNPLAWKIIVVVGDSSLKGPDHPDPSARDTAGGYTIAQIKTQAQPASSGTLQELLTAGYTISVVRVKDPRAESDHAIGDKQYHDLVDGRQYQGRLIEARGGEDPEDFSGSVIDFIQEKIKNFDEAIIKGKDPAAIIAGSAAKPDNIPYPLIKLLQHAQNAGSVTEAFHSGFCSERDANGDLLFSPAVFVRKGNLKLFNAMLQFIQQELESQGDPGSRSVERLVKNMKMMAASISLDEDVNEDMDLHEFLQILGGFPVKSPIFQMTPKRLVSMTAGDYNDWVSGVKAVTDSIKVLVENPNIWYKLHRDDKDVNDHAFIAVSDLP